MNRLSRLFAAASATILCLAAFAAGPKPARLYLSGEDRASAVDWEFRCSAGAKAGVWTTIPVPSNWEMHGFGTLSYGALEPSESGEYRHRFKVPPSFDGQRIFLVFDGVMTDATATLNGQPLGEKHQGGFYRFKYEVTSLIRTDAENLLEVHVDETSADASSLALFRPAVRRDGTGAAATGAHGACGVTTGRPRQPTSGAVGPGLKDARP